MQFEALAERVIGVLIVQLLVGLVLLAGVAIAVVLVGETQEHRG